MNEIARTEDASKAAAARQKRFKKDAASALRRAGKALDEAWVTLNNLSWENDAEAVSEAMDHVDDAMIAISEIEVG
jgi:hypothetical protein